MASSLMRLVHEARGLWDRLPLVQKGLLAGVGGLAVALLILFVSWSRDPEMVTVYSELTPQDSAAIVEQLKEQGVPYELANGGSTIRVPANKVAEVRLDLATQGLPEGGAKGFEIFDETNFGATELTQRVNYQRGLEGELARTINSLDAVEQSRVHIVLPEKALFREQQQPPSASVVLKLRAGSQLTEEQVRGIAHLVSRSVEGLDTKNITIVDTAGNILLDGAAEGFAGAGLTSSQVNIQRSVENTLASRAQSMLDRVLGPNKAVVTVAAQLNFDQIERSTKTYSPTDQNPVLSTNRVEEEYGAQGTGGAFVPGVLPNVPGAGQANAGGGQESTTDYRRQEETINYQVSEVVEHTIETPGSVDRLSVSVLLDEAVPAEQVNQIQQNIAAAVGLDEDRGDQIAITRIPFDTTAQEQAASDLRAQQQREMIFNYARLAIPILAVIIGFVLFRLLLRTLQRQQEAYYNPLLLTTEGEFPLQLGEGEEPAAFLESPPVQEAARQREALSQRVTHMAKQRPQSVAEVLQMWLREE
ncbi:MAG TPA: flagellar basal-body MS-ring/collar protein FliF [Dehalococcoidia bacterium]